jgi:hypothetical protein
MLWMNHNFLDNDFINPTFISMRDIHNQCMNHNYSIYLSKVLKLSAV